MPLFCQELEGQVSRMEEDHIVGKALRSQLTTFHDMEAANRKLTDENTYLKYVLVGV